MSAQSFMRYYMKDGSFNGFYTNCIDSISYIDSDVPISKVHIGDDYRDIAIDNITDILFENATLKNGNLGEYRLYEFDFKEQEFKKIYVDNRALLFASKTGDFGANDTIFMCSLYMNIKILMFTDPFERIFRYFDGENYFVLDYQDDETVNIVNNLSLNKISIANKSVVTKSRVGISNFYRFNKFLRFSETMREYGEYSAGKSIDLNMKTMQMAAQIHNNIENNPELHNTRLIVNSLSVAGDIAGIAASSFSVIPSGGLTLPVLALQVYDLYNDTKSLLDEMHPDSDMIDEYEQFYANKYGISVLALPAVDVEAMSAVLKGYIGSNEDLKGNLYFVLSNKNTGHTIEILASKNEAVNNQYDAYALVKELFPDTWYTYYLEYKTMVNGLTLKFTSDIQEFKTEAKSIKLRFRTNSSSAYFSNVDEIFSIFPNETFYHRIGNYTIEYNETGIEHAWGEGVSNLCINAVYDSGNIWGYSVILWYYSNSLHTNWLLPSIEATYTSSSIPTLTNGTYDVRVQLSVIEE